jgi:hypothetical protein
MTENRRQILEMLAAGKITAEEADRLIGALHEGQPAPAPGPEKPAPKYLRVIIDSAESYGGPTKINVRVPIQLLRAGVRLGSLIPSFAQERVNQALREQGLDMDIAKLRPENLNELIDELRDLSVDINQEKDDVKIRVFSE